MKYTLYILWAIFIIGTLLLSSCAMFQPGGNPGDTLADLPTTGSEAMFQVLKKQNWLLTLSVVGVGAGFYAFLNGSSKGIQVMASCFVVLSLIIGMTKYSAVIAAVAMIGAVCLMIYSTLVKGKAIREVVQGVQIARSCTGNRSDEKIMLDAIASRQSKTTKAIVKAVKGKL